MISIAEIYLGKVGRESFPVNFLENLLPKTEGVNFGNENDRGEKAFSDTCLGA